MIKKQQWVRFRAKFATKKQSDVPWNYVLINYKDKEDLTDQMEWICSEEDSRQYRLDFVKMIIEKIDLPPTDWALAEIDRLHEQSNLLISKANAIRRTIFKTDVKIQNEN